MTECVRDRVFTPLPLLPSIVVVLPPPAPVEVEAGVAVVVVRSGRSPLQP